MAGTLGYTRERLRKLATQLRHLPRTVAMVRRAGGRLVFLWGALLIVQGLLPVAIVYLTRAVVNALLAAIRAGGNFAALRPLLALALAIGLVLLCSQLLRSAIAWVRLAQSEQVRDYLAGLIHRKSLDVDLAFYDSSDFYDHLHRARLEATYRPIELMEGIGGLLQSCVSAVAILAVLASFGPVLPLALLLSAIPVFYAAVSMAHRRHIWMHATTTDDRRCWYYDQLVTDGDSAAELRLFDLGDHFAREFQNIRRRLRGGRLDLARKESLVELCAGSFTLLVLGATMSWLAFQALHGKVSPGDLALAYQAINQALGVFRTALENLAKLYDNSLFLGNLFEFLDLEPKIVSPSPGRRFPSTIAQGIRFEAVEFSYPNSNRRALRNFNLTLRPGEIVAIVGPNGTGKTTLVKLLCRLYDPDRGSITIDGIPLHELSLPELQRSISVFLQQPIRFNETVDSNIRYGNLDASDGASAIQRAAALSGFAEVIPRLPRGYQTQLGRGYLDGAGLSVGEWHRLALARANYRRAPILILDEPTSAMDPWAEQLWVRRLRQNTGTQIVVLITHRFTTAVFADVIHVMSEGCIVESGSHAELLARGGSYAQGWASQTQSS
jgi:ATP-binding cassette, subfamily B, bacterial